MYRPWQARDALIKLLEQTKKNARAEIEEVQVLKVKVDRVLRGIAQNCEDIVGESEDRIEVDPDAVTGVEQGKQMEATNGILKNGVADGAGGDRQERRLWALLDEDSDG